MEEVKEYSVYKHTCPNGKVYIGITRMALEKRWANGKGYNHNAHFSRAIKKYGWDKIKHEVLYTNLTKHEASDKERKLIQKYKSYNLKFGYNKDLGGCYCDRFTKKTRKKMSEAKKGKTHTMSEESKKRLGILKKEKWANKEYKEWAIERINKTNKRKVKCIETNKVYNSIKEASEDTGANQNYISSCCKDKNRTSNGYHWEYVGESKRKLTNKLRNNKKVAQYDNEGKFLKLFNSVSEAERITGEARSTIKRSADKKKKYVMKNKYIWRYIDNCILLNLKMCPKW